jgi:hypothetical protein
MDAATRSDLASYCRRLYVRLVVALAFGTALEFYDFAGTVDLPLRTSRPQLYADFTSL